MAWLAYHAPTVAGTSSGRNNRFAHRALQLDYPPPSTGDEYCSSMAALSMKDPQNSPPACRHVLQTHHDRQPPAAGGRLDPAGNNVAVMSCWAASAYNDGQSRHLQTIRLHFNGRGWHVHLRRTRETPQQLPSLGHCKSRKSWRLSEKRTGVQWHLGERAVQLTATVVLRTIISKAAKSLLIILAAALLHGCVAGTPATSSPSTLAQTGTALTSLSSDGYTVVQGNVYLFENTDCPRSSSKSFRAALATNAAAPYAVIPQHSYSRRSTMIRPPRFLSI